MKKFLFTLPIIAVLALASTVALPAAAHTWHWNMFGGSTMITSSNSADVNNSVFALSETGDNTANNNDEGGTVTTGMATTLADLQNMVNSNDTRLTSDCGCTNDVKTFSFNRADVDNMVTAMAKTGDNSADNNDDGGKVMTGDASTGVSISNMINTNFTRIMRSMPVI